VPKSYSLENLTFSIGLLPITAKWVDDQAKKVGSFNRAIRKVLEKREISVPGKGPKTTKR